MGPFLFIADRPSDDQITAAEARQNDLAEVAALAEARPVGVFLLQRFRRRDVLRRLRRGEAGAVALPEDGVGRFVLIRSEALQQAFRDADLRLGRRCRAVAARPVGRPGALGDELRGARQLGVDPLVAQQLQPLVQGGAEAGDDGEEDGGVPAEQVPADGAKHCAARGSFYSIT